MYRILFIIAKIQQFVTLQDQHATYLLHDRYMDCKPDNGGRKCVVCGWVWNHPNHPFPRRNCDNPPDLRPAASALGISTANIKHYVQALARWTAASMPTRNQAEVERLETICVACEHYRNGRCARCGCCVNKSRVAVRNKIKMATENCPIKKW